MVQQLKRVIAAMVAALALACVSSGPAHAYEPRVPESYFGVSATELWALTAQGRNAERDRQLDGMKQAGIDWARIEIGWPEVEPNAPVGAVHNYRWETSDRLVTALASRGMELMALPMATPAWAAGDASCGRRSGVAQGRVSDYASFVEAVMRRYGRNGTFWAAHQELSQIPVRRVEIWNEPNWNGFWCAELQPEVYGNLAKAAADRIHAVDPEAQAILGGLADLKEARYEGGVLRGLPVDEFLRRALTAQPGLASAIDAVGFHPYDLDPAVNLSLIGWLRRVLEEQGMGSAEIVLTEFGWRSGGLVGALSELLRTQNFTELAGQLPRIDCGVTAVAAHTWQSRELDLSNPSDWFGLVSPLTGLLYPSGQAYIEQVALYEGRGPTPAPRTTIEVCGSPAAPDQDSDGTPDQDDDYPTDPEQDSGSGESPPPPPEEEPVEPRTQPQRAPDSFFGATVVQLPDDFTRLGAEYEAMASARIGTVRQRLDWAQIEPLAPSDPDYARRSQWSWLDRLVLKMSAAGIGFQPAIGKLPGWAPRTGGAFDAEHAAFMARVARRYGRGGSFWDENRNLDADRFAVRDYEVWQYGNANAHTADGVASAAEYAATYASARNAVKAVDGQARVFASLVELGETGRAGDFLRAMVAARPELAGSVDGVLVMAEHSRTVAAIDGVLANVRHALDETGNAGAPIFLAFGAPVAGPEAVTEATRAQLLADVASRAARGDCGVGGIFAHAWTTPELDPANSWHWFGIANKNTAALSASAEAYRDTAAAFYGYGDQAAPTGAVHPCSKPAPDTDGDGTADPADPAPLDPLISTPTAVPPPAPTISGAPASPTVNRTATFSLTASGATSFQCKLGALRYEQCGSSPSYSGLTHGQHELRVRAVNALGLVGPEAIARWVVDVVGPNMAEVTGPGPVSLDSRVRFDFRADEPSAKIACRLDGAAWEYCTSPKIYGFVGDGPHEVRIAAIDTLGNVGPITVKAFEVRTTPGAPSITAGPADGATAGPTPEFRFTAASAAGYECRFDALSWAPCSSPGAHRPATPLADGSHAFEVRAVGGTGVRGPVASRTFQVDASGPALKIIPGKVSARRAVFRFAVADTSGVTQLSCRLDTRSWRACASPHVLRALRRGRHALQARATDKLGNATLAASRWRTRRR